MWLSWKIQLTIEYKLFENTQLNKRYGLRDLKSNGRDKIKVYFKYISS